MELSHHHHYKSEEHNINNSSTIISEILKVNEYLREFYEENSEDSFIPERELPTYISTLRKELEKRRNNGKLRFCLNCWGFYNSSNKRNMHKGNIPFVKVFGRKKKAKIHPKIENKYLETFKEKIRKLIKNSVGDHWKLNIKNSIDIFSIKPFKKIIIECFYDDPLKIRQIDFKEPHNNRKKLKIEVGNMKKEIRKRGSRIGEKYGLEEMVETPTPLILSKNIDLSAIVKRKEKEEDRKEKKEKKRVIEEIEAIAYILAVNKNQEEKIKKLEMRIKNLEGVSGGKEEDKSNNVTSLFLSKESFLNMFKGMEDNGGLT